MDNQLLVLPLAATSNESRLGNMDNIISMALCLKTQMPQLPLASPLHLKSNIGKKMNPHANLTWKLQFVKFLGENKTVWTQNHSLYKQNCFLPVPPAFPAWHSEKSHEKLICSYPGTAHVTNVHNLDAKNHQDISTLLNHILLYPLWGAQSINFYAKTWLLLSVLHVMNMER